MLNTYFSLSAIILKKNKQCLKETKPKTHSSMHFFVLDAEFMSKYFVKLSSFILMVSRTL